MDKELYVLDILKLFRKKIQWLIVGLVVTLPLAILVTTQWMTPIYQSRVEFIVSPTASSQQFSTNQLKTISDLMRTFQTIILSDNILSKAKNDLALDFSNDELREKITVRFGSDTQAFDLLINDASPQQAESIARAMSTIIQDDLLKYYESNLTIREISPAKTSDQPIAPSLRNNLLVTAFITFLLWAVSVIVVELANPFLKSSRYLESFGWTNLGTLYAKENSLQAKSSKFKVATRKAKTTAYSPNAYHEEIELTRVKIEHDLKQVGAKTVLVTSPSSPSNSALIAANLAKSWAQEGKRVALVDGNLRRATLHNIFRVANDTGLTVYLADDNLEIPAHHALDNLTIFPSGPAYAEPSELWSTHRLPQLLTYLEANFDWVIFETASFQDFADTKIMAFKIPRIVVGTKINSTKAKDIQSLAAFTQKYEINVLGFVTEDEHGGNE